MAYKVLRNLKVNELKYFRIKHNQLMISFQNFKMESLSKIIIDINEVVFMIVNYRSHDNKIINLNSFSAVLFLSILNALFYQFSVFKDKEINKIK